MNILNLWSWLQENSTILTVLIAPVTGVLSSLATTWFTQYKTAKNTQLTNDTQRFISNRNAATFISDKRQKWIDDIRHDMAIHLASSLEYVQKWEVIRTDINECNSDMDDKIREYVQDYINQPICDESTLRKELNIILDGYLEKTKELRLIFREQNGDLDKKHLENHFRIKFRLNPREENHRKLIENLDNIRETMKKIQLSSENTAKCIQNMELLISESQKLTEIILKSEWERIKQEIVSPDLLIRTNIST